MQSADVSHDGRDPLRSLHLGPSVTILQVLRELEVVVSTLRTSLGTVPTFGFVLGEAGHLETPAASRVAADVILVQADHLFQLEVPPRRRVELLPALGTLVLRDLAVAVVADDVTVRACQDLAKAVRSRDADGTLEFGSKFSQRFFCH